MWTERGVTAFYIGPPTPVTQANTHVTLACNWKMSDINSDHVGFMFTPEQTVKTDEELIYTYEQNTENQ